MTDKEKIVHDLALIHAKEKYHEFFQSVSPKGRPFPTEINELVNFYQQGVIYIAPQIDEIMEAYLDDNGEPLIED